MHGVQEFQHLRKEHSFVYFYPTEHTFISENIVQKNF